MINIFIIFPAVYFVSVHDSPSGKKFTTQLSVHV